MNFVSLFKRRIGYYQGLRFIEHDCDFATMHRCELVPGSISATIFRHHDERVSVLLSIHFGKCLVQPNVFASSLNEAWSEAIAQLHIVSPLAAAVWDEAFANAQDAT